jgi:hypothetical protein
MFTWLWLLLALILFGFAGFFGSPDTPDCGGGADACVPDLVVWTPVAINGHEGVVLPESAARDMLAWTGIEPESYWVPSEADLQQAEDAVAAYAAGMAADDAPMIDGRRQYAGFVEGGERKLYVNSFCGEGFPDWQSNIVFVMDGGSCFWQAVYNVDFGEIEQLMVNGEA